MKTSARARRAFMSCALAGSLLLVATPADPAVLAAGEERRVVLGKSVRGEPIVATNIGARSSPHRVLVVDCIHGNECAGRRIIRKLRRTASPTGFELWLIGPLNPDGARAGTRQNARGVDLNRNFPKGWEPNGSPGDTYHSGSGPASEPETRAAMRFISELKPDVTIWYHQAMRLVTKMKRHRPIQRLYAKRVGLPLVQLDPLPGTATRWQNKTYPGHLAFVVELPGGSLSADSARRHARAVLAVGRAWRDMRASGR